MDWTEFEKNLARTLRDVSDRVLLVISDAHTPRYVQFSGQEDTVQAQCPGLDVVPDADATVLRDSGWDMPGPAEPNWTYWLPLPALSSEYEELAARCIRALRDAYHLASPDSLHYRAWREPELMPPGVTMYPEQIAELDPGEDPLPLPTLGIPAD